MAFDAYNTVRNCVECAKRRIKLRKHASFLKLFPAKCPGEHVAIDILGPLPRTQSGYQYILCMTDRYSKLALVAPLRTITALRVAQEFCREWVYHYGQPTYLLSDRGTQFTSSFFNAVCDTLNIKQAFTSAYHPQANGQVERFNRTLVASLKCYCSEHGKDWDKFVHAIAYGYNCTVHRATGYTPFDLMLTYPPPHLAISKSEQLDLSELNVNQTKEKLLRRLQHLMKTSGQTLKKAQERYKANFDERVRPTSHVYRPGDMVYVRREANASGMPDHKLRTEVTDPLPIQRVNTAARYVVVKLPDNTESTVSFDRLSPLPPRMVPDKNTKNLVPTPKQQDTVDESHTPKIPQLTPSTQPSTPERRRSPRLHTPTPDVHALERDSYEPRIYKRNYIVSFDPQRDKYRVRWHGYPTIRDTYEYAQFIPRNLVCDFRRKRFLPPLANSLWK